MVQMSEKLFDGQELWIRKPLLTPPSNEWPAETRTRVASPSCEDEWRRSHLDEHRVLPVFGLVCQVWFLCAGVPNQDLKTSREQTVSCWSSQTQQKSVDNIITVLSEHLPAETRSLQMIGSWWKFSILSLVQGASWFGLKQCWFESLTWFLYWFRMIWVYSLKC